MSDVRDADRPDLPDWTVTKNRYAWDKAADLPDVLMGLVRCVNVMRQWNASRFQSLTVL